MKNCPKCNKELNDTAKFCGRCGCKLSDVQEAPKETSGAVCPKCGNPLKAGAKFCGKCGNKIELENAESASAANGKSMETLGESGYVRWTMLPGQVAVKITEAEIEACGKIKGISIQDGCQGLIFVNGKIVAELPSGSYKISELTELGKGSTPTRTGFLGLLQRAGSAMARAAEAVARAVSGSPSGKPAIAVVLVRSTEFPLLFTVREAPTSGVRSDVGLHLLCKVANINAFYQNLLLDRQFVCYEQLQKSLDIVVRNVVNQAVGAFTPNQVANNPALAQTVLSGLQTAMSGIYPFVSVEKLLQLTADNQALAALQRMGEELYVSEQELVHLQKRNDFLNRLQATKNEQALAEIRAANGFAVDKGQLEAELQARKLEIYKSMSLTRDEQDKFDLMLAAEKKLREASTQEQIDVAMHEYEKTGMLRGQEIDRLRHQGRMADLRNTQEYDMAELTGDIAKRRTQDEYDDERRQKESDFADARRRAEIQLDKEEQQSQMEMLRQAQAIRLEREDAEHRRVMESESAARAHEQAMQQAKLDAEMHTQDNYANMSAEQIKAAQLKHLDAAAQSAMFNADHQAEFLKMREAEMARQSAQQMEMMRMMQQMAMAGIGSNQQHQQELLAAKQSELSRTRDDANRNEDRMLAGVQATVAAAGAAFGGAATGSRQPQRRKDPPLTDSASAVSSAQPKCPKCGAVLEPDSSFCGECGSAL